MAFSSQPFARISITYACHEEAEAERQHENVQHGMFLCDMDREPEQAAFALDGGEVPPGA
jgi:hypothetical protein